jgi:hypothetical protein
MAAFTIAFEYAFEPLFRLPVDLDFVISRVWIQSGVWVQSASKTRYVNKEN